MFDIGEPWIVGEIARLPWILLEIEELHLMYLRIDDELVPFSANTTLIADVAAEDGIVKGLAAVQEWCNAGELNGGWNGCAGEFARSRKHAVLIDEFVDDSSRLNARSRNEQRHAHAAIVEILLAHETVLADGETMVGSKDDIGVRGAARLLERRENSSDLRVQI